uniref:hypothetical protein n=1 Tax=uncultured Nostoc sp. TaxID=340711 RepID=UPI0035CB0790
LTTPHTLHPTPRPNGAWSEFPSAFCLLPSAFPDKRIDFRLLQQKVTINTEFWQKLSRIW